ncbi:MAG: Gx transporter family protein [Lachnospiraceae bacterium]|nr:Gx transporter family protein [Lachnospiraceae bacterium]
MKRTVTLGFLLAVAMILSYVESLIPFSIGIPGMKLGLPNLVVVLLLYLYGSREALLVNTTRIVLSGLLFSNLYTVVYSMAGALCSFGVMLLLKRTGKFSIIGVSIGGGVFHNMGQLLLAMLVVETYAVSFYLPYLMLAGMITGFFIGIAGRHLMPYLKKLIEKMK